MKPIHWIISMTLMLSLSIGCKKQNNMEDIILWYNSPAKDINSALPLGNGSFGALLVGNVNMDTIPIYTNNILGNLYISNLNKGIIKDYYRDLNISTAISTVKYSQNNVEYKREFFTSIHDKVLVIHFSAIGDSGLNISLNTDSLPIKIVTFFPDNNGKLLEDSIGLQISEAKDAYCIISLLKDSVDYDYVKKNYLSFRDNSINSYKKMFEVTTLSMSSKSQIENIPTDERLNKWIKSPDPKFLVTLFQYGRYLLICSSSPRKPLIYQTIWSQEISDGQFAYKSIKEFSTCLKENLLCTVPPSLKNENFLLVKSLSEMLIQSNTSYIHLLPALPNEWSQGSLEGVRAGKGFQVDMEWDDSKLTNVSVFSKLGNDCTIRASSPFKISEIGNSEAIEVNNRTIYQLSFSTTVDEEYDLIF